jgi:ESS family glutamate:Na+ symporter
MNFWDYSVWEFLLQIGFLLIIMLVANTLRRKIPFLRKSLLPTAVIGGFLALAIKSAGVFESGFINNDIMEIITYHTLALGFISITLKTSKEKITKEQNVDIFNSGIITVATYLLQAVIGLGLTLLLSYTLFPNLFKASGLLLPLGFGQGSGQAYNFGNIYEGYGFTEGASFGLSIAAVGFIFACVGGVIYLNIMRKKGKIQNIKSATQHYVSEEIESPNEIPLTEAVDKFSIQVAFVCLVYVLTYLFMKGVTYIIELGVLGDFGYKTLKPLIWGFNFVFGTLFAIIVKLILKKLQKRGLMKRVYINNFMLNRIGGFMFDLMIIAGICAIDIKQLSTLWIPLTILSFAGGFSTFYYLRYLCNKLFPKYPIQAFMSLYGMLTGTTSTGMVLLREIDPNFETPAASNLVLQSFYAILFGFPMMLLLGYAPLGTKETWITFGAVILFFVIMNILLFRKYIFKGKNNQS